MNNEIKFDPMTGEPINNNIDENIQEETTNFEPQNIELEFQSIPTVEQNQEDFINNIQSINNKEKKEEKKETINFSFIIIMFLIIFLSIILLFPRLLNYI